MHSIYHTTFRGFAYRIVANITLQSWATEDIVIATDEHLMPWLQRNLLESDWVLLPRLALSTKRMDFFFLLLLLCITSSS